MSEVKTINMLFITILCTIFIISFFSGCGGDGFREIQSISYTIDGKTLRETSNIIWQDTITYISASEYYAAGPNYEDNPGKTTIPEDRKKFLNSQSKLSDSQKVYYEKYVIDTLAIKRTEYKKITYYRKNFLINYVKIKFSDDKTILLARSQSNEIKVITPSKYNITYFKN